VERNATKVKDNRQKAIANAVAFFVLLFNEVKGGGKNRY
jgi:hypothetical protein